MGQWTKDLISALGWAELTRERVSRVSYGQDLGCGWNGYIPESDDIDSPTRPARAATGSYQGTRVAYGSDGNIKVAITTYVTRGGNFDEVEIFLTEAEQAKVEALHKGQELLWKMCNVVRDVHMGWGDAAELPELLAQARTIIRAESELEQLFQEIESFGEFSAYTEDLLDQAGIARNLVPQLK